MNPLPSPPSPLPPAGSTSYAPLRRISKGTRRHAVVLLALLSAQVALTGCGGSGGPGGAEILGTAAAARPVVQVSAGEVRASEQPLPAEVVGTVRPSQRALIAPKLMGPIDSLPVTLGQPVVAGEVLARISAAESLARVAQARAQLNLAQRDLERERSLLAQGASTADLVRALEDRATLTTAMVREAEVMLGYAEIRAPFAGVVVRKMAQPGDFASPGFPLLELEGTSDFQIEANLPESLAAGLSVGQAVPALAPGSGSSFSAVLAELSPSAEAAARTVPVKFTVPAGTRVRSGEFIRLRLPGPVVRRLSIPANAVSTLGQMERVFIVSGDRAGTGTHSHATTSGPRAGLRLIRTGVAMANGTVEILSGLDAGERVVLNPPASLREGDRLEVLP